MSADLGRTAVRTTGVRNCHSIMRDYSKKTHHSTHSKHYSTIRRKVKKERDTAKGSYSYWCVELSSIREAYLTYVRVT